MNPFFQMLKNEHKEVKGILAQLTATKAGSVTKREGLFQRLSVALVPHMKAEKWTFYQPLVANEDSGGSPSSALSPPL